MEDKMYIKIYTNCSVCIGKGIVESVSFRNTNVCPVCKGVGKNEHLITLEEFKKMLLDYENQ